MESYVLDWVNLLLRWAHVVVAVAWIGASFYFVFLDNNLTAPEDPEARAKGIGGELWAVHGGGFYNPQKYPVSPKTIPEHLHWFYWESYFTWMTGFALFTVLYLYQASTFLIDKNVHDWSAPAAIVSALAFLAVFWIVYDVICRTLGQRRNGDNIVGALVACFVVLASWLACSLFSGRAAFVLVGAMMATSMSANVFFWIIPGQRAVVAQMRAGQPVDPIYGQRAKQRSVHNTYFTLPVLIAMLSNHYGFLYGAPANWLVLVVTMTAGALIRHSFVARHQALINKRPVPWGYAIAGCALLIGVMVWIAPALPNASTAKAAPVTFAEVRKIIADRCVLCHNAEMNNKGIMLHTPELISKNAQAIYQQAVVLKAMPFGNATQMTPEERATLGRWFEAGAKVDAEK